MKEIKLTQGKVALVDDSNYDRLISMGKWYAQKSRNGVFYVCKKVAGSDGKFRFLSMHRFLAGINDWSVKVDHANGDGLDNRMSNIRLSTNSQNLMNRGKTSLNSSGYKGVTWSKKGKAFYASITHNKKTIHLGTFNDKVSAAIAYNAAAIQFHGEFAKLNQI